MGADTRFYDNFMRMIKQSIHTTAVASVVKFYEESQEADIQPLFLMSANDGELTKLPMINRVPVAGMRYKINHPIPASINGGPAVIVIPDELIMTPSLKMGDVVVVNFAERALDDLQAVPFDPDSTRTHHIQDAIITGILFNV